MKKQKFTRASACASAVTMLMSGLGAVCAATAVAQQSPPSLATKDFKAHQTRCRDSVPDWGPTHPRKRLRERPTFLFVLYTTPVLLPVGIRRQINIADAGQVGCERFDLHAMAYVCAFAPDPVTILDRTQPSRQRHGQHHGGANGIPWSPTPQFRCVRHHRADPPGQRLEQPFWLGTNHTLPEQDVASGASPAMALSEGLRPFFLLTALLAARPTNGIPTLSRTTGSSSNRMGPEEGITSPGPCRQAITNESRPEATNPSRRVPSLFLPGANHALTNAAEYI